MQQRKKGNCTLLCHEPQTQLVRSTSVLMVPLLQDTRAEGDPSADNVAGVLRVHGTLKGSVCRMEVASAYPAVQLSHVGTAGLAQAGACSAHLNFRFVYE